ncbi:hypothetical protein [Vagococcus carniphilus]|uniref:hypothetical protein n=1 Tax=Vagococcus carniphilus TaxID=218144 RepID=UPI003BAD6495
MKSKKSKKNRKELSCRQKIVYAIYLLIIVLSFYFFFRAYRYISDIPKANNITQEEIYDLTKIGESDIKLVRALKNDAFDSWLYEANDDKVKKLKKTQGTISSVVEGNVKVSKIDDVIAGLKKNVDTISNADIEELYILYYKKVLPKQYKKADESFQKMTVEHPEAEYKDIFALLDLLNKIYNQKGMLTVTNDDNFKKSVSLLEEINSNFTEVNKIKTLVADYDTLQEPIPDPETRLGMELDDYVSKANDYLQSSLVVTAFEQKYDELQSNLAYNKRLIKKSVEVPDLVGLTVEQALRELSKEDLNFNIRGYTNKLYRNGERVLEIQRGIETWDDDKKDKILRQEPSHLEYDFILQGSTIKLVVENNPIEKPKESTEPSSSSTSDTSTTTTSSSEETSTTTTSSSEREQAD